MDTARNAAATDLTQCRPETDASYNGLNARVTRLFFHYM